MSKFGPIYIHFKEHCLIWIYMGTDYGFGNSFDYYRIEVQKDSRVKLNKGEINLLK